MAPPTRASTTAYVCPDGMNCKRIHNVDNNEVFRNAIARIANEPVSQEELIGFQKKRQLWEEVAMTAKRAAKPYHNFDLEQNKLAVKLAKLYHQLRDSYCLFVLAGYVAASPGSRILANTNPDRGATLPMTNNAVPAMTTVSNWTGTLTQLTAEPSEAEPDLSRCGTVRGPCHEPVQNHSTDVTETKTTGLKSIRVQGAQDSMVAVERTPIVPVNPTTKPHVRMTKSTLTMLVMFGVAVVLLVKYNTD